MAPRNKPRKLGRPPGRSGDETRGKLLDAALALFAEHGFAATTVRRIADEVGMRDSAIYAHFLSKQAIYDALRIEMTAQGALDLDPDELTALGPDAAIPAVVDRLLARWSQPTALLFTSLLLREGAGHDGFRGLNDLVAVAVTRLAGSFRQWQHDHRLRDDIHPEQLVWELLAPLHIVRFLHLRAGATEYDLAAARRTARAHLSFYLTCTLIDPKQQ